MSAEHDKSETYANPNYRANFLWAFEDGSVEEAGYEFANARTPASQKQWWDILCKRLKEKSDVLTFTQKILHGSKEHQEWLSDAAEQFLRDGTVPDTRG